MQDQDSSKYHHTKARATGSQRSVIVSPNRAHVNIKLKFVMLNENKNWQIAQNGSNFSNYTATIIKTLIVDTYYKLLSKFTDYWVIDE